MGMDSMVVSVHMGLPTDNENGWHGHKDIFLEYADKKGGESVFHF